ncbi:MAG: transcriptional regulator [Deltaproteobacteria bacterium]|nr:transcriptional regulator [Deltaproteobacteria bacterium]
MARGDQLGRQWKIIRKLIASNRGKSIRDLASELGCHPRTVYRDLDALQVAGFPVYNERVDNKSRWALLESAKHLIPVPFNVTELMALYFSRDMLKSLKETIFYDALESLFQKVKTTLPPEYLQYLAQIEDSLKVGLKSYKNYGKHGDIINSVNSAVVNRTYITIRYYAMNKKKISRRTVAPYKIWFFDGTFYMLGFCRLRKAIRLFALDRIKSLEITDENFETPDDFDIDEMMQSSFGTFLGEPVEVLIRFSADIAGYIEEKVWHESQEIEQQDDGSILFRIRVAGTDEIKFWALTWGAKAKVLAPQSLRDEMRNEVGAMLKNYDLG